MTSTMQGVSEHWQASLHITDDRLQAYLVVEPAGAEEAGDAAGSDLAAAVADLLADIGAEAALNDAAVKELCADPAAVCLLIARGRPPVDGLDGAIEIFIPDDPDHKPVEREDGSVDYRERGPWVQVQPGDPLIRYVLPTPGQPGLDVFGKPLPAKDGAPVVISAGSGVTVTEEQEAEGDAVVRRFTAAIQGRPVVRTRGSQGTEVEVRPVLELPGEVDLRTGNVRFDGHVTIGGSVEDDMSVEATGDVLIRGSVNRAKISAGGSVEVRGGTFQSTVTAGAEARLGYVHQSNVDAAAAITLSGKGAYISRLAAPTIIINGAIVGGEAHAEHKLEAREAGSRMGADTLLEAGAKGIIRVSKAHPQVRVVVGGLSQTLRDEQSGLFCRLVGGELRLR